MLKAIIYAKSSENAIIVLWKMKKYFIIIEKYGGRYEKKTNINVGNNGRFIFSWLW